MEFCIAECWGKVKHKPWGCYYVCAAFIQIIQAFHANENHRALVGLHTKVLCNWCLCVACVFKIFDNSALIICPPWSSVIRLLLFENSSIKVLFVFYCLQLLWNNDAGAHSTDCLHSILKYSFKCIFLCNFGRQHTYLCIYKKAELVTYFCKLIAHCSHQCRGFGPIPGIQLDMLQLCSRVFVVLMKLPPFLSLILLY